MKSLRLVTVLALAAAATLATGASADDPPVVAGNACGGSAIARGGAQTALMYGGPMYGGSRAHAVADVYLLCTIQLGANSTHAAPDTHNITVWSVGAAAIPPTVVSYEAPPGTPAYLCSEVWVDTNKGHVSVFLDAPSGTWSTSADATCARLPATSGGGFGDGPGQLELSVQPIAHQQVGTGSVVVAGCRAIASGGEAVVPVATEVTCSVGQASRTVAAPGPVAYSVVVTATTLPVVYCISGRATFVDAATNAVFTVEADPSCRTFAG